MLTIHEKRMKKEWVNQVSYKQIQAFSTKKKKNQSSTYNLIRWWVQAWPVFEKKSKYNHEHLTLVYLTRL